MGQLSYRNEDIVNERQASLDYLPEITNRILKVSDHEMIILFGSYARGDFGMDSDLDLLVVLKGVESPRKEITRLRRSLRGMLVSVDILVATPEQIERHRNNVGLIYRSVLREGKVIYERDDAV